MSPDGQPGLGDYARAVETMWTDLLDRPVVLSRRDWDLISGWFERNIPLQLIQEALHPAEQDSGGGRRTKRPPRSLSYVAPAVEEAWSVVLSGRVQPQSVDESIPGKRDDRLAHWKNRRSREAPGSPLHTLLTEILDRLARGDTPLELDQFLEEGLVEAAPEAILVEIEQQVELELAEFRGKMPPHAMKRTRTHAIMSRLRSELDLPRFACSP